MSFPAGGDGGPLPRAVVGGSYGGGGCGGRTGTGSARTRGASDATATAGATASGCFLGAVMGNWKRKRKRYTFLNVIILCNCGNFEPNNSPKTQSSTW